MNKCVLARSQHAQQDFDEGADFPRAIFAETFFRVVLHNPAGMPAGSDCYDDADDRGTSAISRELRCPER